MVFATTGIVGTDVCNGSSVDMCYEPSLALFSLNPYFFGDSSVVQGQVIKTSELGVLKATLNRMNVVAGLCLGILAAGGVSCYRTTKSLMDTPLICNALVPIKWSKGDTEKTKEQILEYNAVWKTFCLKNK